jgi:hypothetical protein
LIEYKDYRTCLFKSYKLWLKAYYVKSLDPKVIIYQEDQIKKEDVYYFVQRAYDFRENREEAQGKLEKAASKF